MKPKENTIEANTPEELLAVSDEVQSRLKEIGRKSVACKLLDSEDFDENDPTLYRTDAVCGNNIYFSRIIPHQRHSISLMLNPDASPTGSMQDSEKYTLGVAKHSTAQLYLSETDIRLKKAPFTLDSVTKGMMDSLLDSLDKRLIDLAGYAVAATGNSFTTPKKFLDGEDLIEAAKKAMVGELLPSSILLRKDDFMAILMNRDSPSSAKVEIDVGDSSMVPPGGTYESMVLRKILRGAALCLVNGLRVVLLANDELVKPGNIYIFAEPQSIGKIILDVPHFEIERKFDIYQWQSNVLAAMNIFNVFGISRVELNAEEPVKPGPVEDEFTEDDLALLRRIKTQLDDCGGGDVVIVGPKKKDLVRKGTPTPSSDERKWWQKLFNLKQKAEA